jgi:hypothetical protein
MAAGRIGPSSEVQCGQRVAAIAIGSAQKGQSFRGGSGAGASFVRIRSYDYTTRNTAKATIRKAITLLMNSP